MRLLNTLVLLLIISFSAQAQKLSFFVKGQEDAEVHLVKYVGGKLYYADTAQIVKERVTFDGAKQDAGIMALLLPGQSYFEFIYNNEEVSIETKTTDFIDHMVVKKSEENKVFLDYLKYVKSKRMQNQTLQAERDHADEAAKEEISERMQKLANDVLEYQNKVVSDNPNLLVSKIIKMSTDIQIPEPQSSEVDINKFKYNYFRDHYFDNIDLTDDRLVNTPVIKQKLDYFYSNLLAQIPDTIIKHVFKVIDRIPENTMMYRYFVTSVTSHFEQSKIMGMDKVSNHMINRYYCAKNNAGEYKGYWMEEDRLEEICETTAKRLKIMVGEVPPNIVLPDSTNKWYDLHKLDAEYTVLYFWDPGCGHCKKVTPKLGELYDKKFKERNVEIFSVGKATGSDFKDWKDFIKKNDLKFINVGVTQELYEKAKENAMEVILKNKTTIESINYQDTYDIYSTPRVFILDKDKKIIAKSLSVAQIEHMIDELQGFKDAEKLFKLETEDPDNKMD